MLFGMQHNKRTNKMEDIIEKLKSEINQLKEQREELLKKLKQVESSSKSLIYEEDVPDGVIPPVTIKEENKPYYNQLMLIQQYIHNQIESNDTVLFLLSLYEDEK
jgi:cell division septum initiation protein DivIVA